MTTAPSNTPAPRQRVVTLVHGTWARKSAWTQPESKLCRHLSEIEPPPILRRFQWSGRNAHRARLRAADALARQLAATCAEYPDADHHVIAHSHGGNVTLHALRDPSLARHIASVVCLATPFIHAAKRPLDPAFLVLRVALYSLLLAPGAALVLLTLLFTAIVPQAHPDSEFALFLQHAWAPWPLILAGLASMSGLLVWGGLRYARKASIWLTGLLRPRLERSQQRWQDEYDHRPSQPLPLLNVQVERDEAGTSLRLLRWAAEPQGDSGATLLVAAMFSLMLGAAFIWNIVHDPEATESLFSLAFFALFTVFSMLAVWLVMLLLGLVMVHTIFMVVPFLIRGHGLGFGEWSFFANWLMSIQARPDPPPGYKPATFQIDARGKGLRHSQVYEDDRVISHIVEWVMRTTTDAR